MALSHIDPKPRPDEVSLHPPGHPHALPKTSLHEHEVVEVGKQLDAVSFEKHNKVSLNV
jgi:hypothetical protein